MRTPGYKAQVRELLADLVDVRHRFPDRPVHKTTMQRQLLALRRGRALRADPAHAERMLAKLRHLEATGTPEEKRVFARTFTQGADWPPEISGEVEEILARFRAGGIAPPSWGHAGNVLALITKKENPHAHH